MGRLGHNLFNSGPESDGIAINRESDGIAESDKSGVFLRKSGVSDDSGQESEAALPPGLGFPEDHKTARIDRIAALRALH